MFSVQLFKERLRKAREEKGINQEQFAKEVGIARASASYYENPKNKAVPTIDTLYEISKVLGVSYNYLMGDDISPLQDEEAMRRSLGLSPKAIRVLRNMQEHPELNHERFRVFNFLIENAFYGKLLEDIYQYLFMVYYLVDQDDFGFPIDVENAKLYSSFGVVGLSEDVKYVGQIIHASDLNEIYLSRVQRDLAGLKELIDKQRQEAISKSKDPETKKTAPSDPNTGSGEHK